jgi:NADPH:quinone reductase
VRAIEQRGFGGVEVLALAEVAQPVPSDGDVLISASRAGVNFTDLQCRAMGIQTMVDHGGAPRRLGPEDLPIVPGGEVAGTTGDGRRVVAICRTGGYAEFAVASRDLTFPVPDDVTDEQALALLVQGLTAWYLLERAARLAAGESVVVLGASGGVGSLAVQLARHFRAGTVIAVASTDEKRATALELGATTAVDPGPDGLSERILSANDGRRVDVVLDSIGGTAFAQSLEALAPGGRIVSYGTAGGAPGEVSTRSLIIGSKSVVGFWLMDSLRDARAAREPLRELFELLRAGTLNPLVEAVYPLSEAARAQLDVAERRTRGKVTLDPSR